MGYSEATSYIDAGNQHSNKGHHTDEDALALGKMQDRTNHNDATDSVGYTH